LIFEQGTVKLAVVNSTDLVKLMMTHLTMKSLIAEAATAFVQREMDAAGGIARALQAATAPTGDQRMLQAGFEGAIVEGESHEQTSTSTDAAGNMHTERLSERTSTLPDGQTVVVQQAQHVVQAPAVDQNILLAAISTGNMGVMTHQTNLNEKTILHVNTVVKKESDARKKAVKNIGAKYDARFKTQAKESKTQADEMIAINHKNAALEARLAALEAGCVSDKKARTASNVVANHKKKTFG